MAFVASDLSWRVKVVVMTGTDVFARYKVGNVETNNLSRFVVRCDGFVAPAKAWEHAKVYHATNANQAVERPYRNAWPDEAIEVSVRDIANMTASCQ